MKEKLQEGLNLEDEEAEYKQEHVDALINVFCDKGKQINATWNELLTANATIAATASAILAKEAENMEQVYRELLQMQNDRMSAMLEDIKDIIGEQELEALKEIALEQTEQE